MDMEWLRTFVVAASEENFHRTAEKLHLAQPTVSMHIDKLEQQLGVRLFERVGRTVRLGAAGRKFLVHAEAALAAVSEGEQAVVRLQQGYDASVTVAVSPLIATTYLPRFVRAFGGAHPNVDISVQVMESEDIASYLAEGKGDIGFSRTPSDRPHIQSTVLYEDPVVGVAPLDAHDHDGPPQDLAELLELYPLLTHNHPLYWDDLLLPIRRMYPAMRTLRVSQVHVTVHWIEAGMGASFLPVSTVRRSLALGHLAEVQTPEWTLPVAHTYLLQDTVTMTDAARAFAGFVRDYMEVREV